MKLSPHFNSGRVYCTRTPIIATVCCALFVLSAGGQTADPGQLFQEAKSAQQRGDYASAIEQYRQVVKARPALLPAWINLGVSLVQAGRFPEAIDSYQTALALDPHHRQARLYLGLAYFKKGDAANASRQFEQIFSADPKDVRVATLLGASYLQSGENERALATLEPLAQAAGDDPDFLWALGSALIANHRLREGVAAVEKVGKQTNGAEPWLVAGQNLLTLNEFVKAKDDLEIAARLNPDLPGVQTALGQARERNGDYKGAIQAYRKAVEQNPKDLEALLGLGSDLYFERDLDGARSTLKQALTVAPKSAPGLYAMALVEKVQGQPAAAAADLEQAVKIRPDWLEAHVQLAALYVQLHRMSDGAREREIVDRLTEELRRAGPGKF